MTSRPPPRVKRSKPPPSGKKIVSIALLICCALALALYASFPNHPRVRQPAAAPSSALDAASAPTPPP